MGELLYFEVFRPLLVNVHLLVLLILPHTLLTLLKYILVIQTKFFLKRKWLDLGKSKYSDGERGGESKIKGLWDWMQWSVLRKLICMYRYVKIYIYIYNIYNIYIIYVYMIDSLYYHSTIWQYIAISPICICILTLSDVALLPFVSVFKSYVSLSVFMWWWYVCVCMCVCVCLCVCVCIPHLHHFYQYSLSGVYLSTFAYSRRFSFFFVYLA